MLVSNGPNTSPTACPRCGFETLDQGPGTVCPLCSMALQPVHSSVGEVADSRPCLQCGYSLQGLKTDGVCPECGTPIVRSLQGNLLVYSSSDFVARLRTGAALILWGLALLAIWVLCHVVGIARIDGASLLFGLLSIVGSLLGLIGWWLLSSPDPALVGQDKTISTRKVLRAMLVVSFVAFAAGYAAEWGLSIRAASLRSGRTDPLWLLARQAAVASLLVTVVTWPVKTVASLRYVRTLTTRVPSIVLMRRAGMLIRLAIVIAGGVAVMVGVSAALSAFGVFEAMSAFFMLFVCAGFVAVLVWCLTYAGLIAGLRSELAAISRRQTRIRNPAPTDRYQEQVRPPCPPSTPAN